MIFAVDLLLPIVGLGFMAVGLVLGLVVVIREVVLLAKQVRGSRS